MFQIVRRTKAEGRRGTTTIRHSTPWQAVRYPVKVGALNMPGRLSQAGEGGRMKFHFIGGVAALDLVNTNYLWEGRRVETLSDGGAVRAWLGELRTEHPSLELPSEATIARIPARKLLAATRTTRAALDTIVDLLVAGSPVPEAALAQLNRVLAGYTVQFRMHAEKRDMELYEVVGGDELSRVLGPIIATLEATEFNRNGRLRRCTNRVDCSAAFYDTSKSATRRFCVPEICGNRVRLARHYAKRRSEA